MVVFKAEPDGKKSEKGTKSQLTSEFQCNCYPLMSAEILWRFAAEHRVDFHWASVSTCSPCVTETPRLVLKTSCSTLSTFMD